MKADPTRFAVAERSGISIENSDMALDMAYDKCSHEIRSLLRKKLFEKRLEVHFYRNNKTCEEQSMSAFLWRSPSPIAQVRKRIRAPDSSIALDSSSMPNRVRW